ncbi:hypothetical protein QJS10_CPB22g01058 [Acorus calamus]|uniref:Uncharacterized protein n=1 Tax=Acorus calamus TaxID=4465 RepID=A0AAV9C0L1_ACOCL|nr:hypothetical protein QJS10_CPB22g01058 [Acorus calamus]
MKFTVKEIVMEKVRKKLQNNLLFEIHILRKINQPNIIRLYDMIEMECYEVRHGDCRAVCIRMDEVILHVSE